MYTNKVNGEKNSDFLASLSSWRSQAINKSTKNAKLPLSSEKCCDSGVRGQRTAVGRGITFKMAVSKDLPE